MKISTLILACLLVGTISKAQQRVTKDAQGNYHAVKRIVGQDTAVSKFTDSKGTVYPVFKSVNNKLYYEKISKAGNSYRVYLKEN